MIFFTDNNVQVTEVWFSYSTYYYCNKTYYDYAQSDL